MTARGLSVRIGAGDAPCGGRQHRDQVAASREEARDLLRDFKRFPVRTTPSILLISAALDIATRCNRTVYDSLYLALAMSQRCRLVTADRRLYDGLKRSPLAPALLWVEDVSEGHGAR